MIIAGAGFLLLSTRIMADFKLNVFNTDSFVVTSVHGPKDNIAHGRGWFFRSAIMESCYGCI